MQLDRMYLERELIPINFDACDLDIFAERKIVEAHCKKLGYTVISGSDFENNMVFALKDNFDYLDPYMKVKLGRAKGSPLLMAYANQVLEHLNKEDVMTLLYLCRLCSYLGGPGFPEFIVIDPKIRKWSLIIVAEEVPAECALFAFMVRLLELCEIKMANIKRNEVSEKAVIDVKNMLEKAVATERFRAFIDSIEGEIFRMKDSVQEDELRYLEEQMYKTPFFLVRKWLREGAAKDDIINAYQKFEESTGKMRLLVERILEEAKTNAEYLSIGNGKDEETVKKKFSWLLKAFGVGESRAKEILGILI